MINKNNDNIEEKNWQLHMIILSVKLSLKLWSMYQTSEFEATPNPTNTQLPISPQTWSSNTKLF